MHRKDRGGKALFCNKGGSVGNIHADKTCLSSVCVASSLIHMHTQGASLPTHKSLPIKKRLYRGVRFYQHCVTS